MLKERIQCIVISEDVNYKNNIKQYLNKSTPSINVTLIDTLLDALAFLNEKPPFKLLIRKHNKPLTREEIKNCMPLVHREMNFRIIVLQKEHEDLISALNANSIDYVQKEKGVFKTEKVEEILKNLEKLN